MAPIPPISQWEITPRGERVGHAVNGSLPTEQWSDGRLGDNGSVDREGRSLGGELPESGRPPAHQSESVQAAASSERRGASLTYEPYYGLKEKPFSLSADPRFFYKGRSHAPAFDDLLAAMRRREGLIVLTGDVGTGKTTLCRAVLQHLDRKTFTTFVPDSFQSREDLLKTLLVDFGVMSIDDLKSGRMKGASRPDLSYPLYDFLGSLAPLQTLAVLMIDEAQNLSLPLLEEIRILSDLESREKSDLEGREKLLQVVLVGQLTLRSRLKLPEMRQIDQRVSARCEIEPLSREAVSPYVTHRLNVAGGDEGITFAADALDIVYSGSGGVPRLINLVCDRALHHAWVKRTARIEPDVIWKAVDDLGLSAAFASATPESLKDHTSPRGLFETSVQTDEPRLQGDLDLRALLTISPATEQTDTSPAEVAGAGPESLDVLAAQPIETYGEGRPEGSARRQQVRHRQEPPARRVSPLDVALVMAALVGAAGLGLAYQRGISLFVADVPSIADLPSPPPLPRAPIFQVQLPPDPATLQQVRRATPPGSSSRPATETAEPYVIQVASFESALRADRLVKALRDQGYRAYQVEVDLGSRGLFQRVFVGRYRTPGEAESDLARIREIPGYGDARILDLQPSQPLLEPR